LRGASRSLKRYYSHVTTKTFRFALGSLADPLSAVWRVWTQEDEVHVAVRATLEEVALTAYPTGRWRIAVGSVVSRWTRPREFRPGWTRGPDLVIPHSAVPVLSPTPDRFATEPVTWLAPPAPGHLARFNLLFASPRAEESRWRPPDAPGTQSVAVLPLRTAGALHICRVDEPLDPEDVADRTLLATVAPPDPTQASNRQSRGFAVIVSADEAGRPSLRESHAL
jgi:hypothetical protein